MIRKLFFASLLLPLLAAGQTAGFDAQMRRAGLVDVRTVDPTLCVRLMYATTDNFVGKNMYGELRTAYLQPDIARSLARAQAALRQEHPGWSLIVFDAARPMSVQRTMFRMVAGTPDNIYVANPAKGGGWHNYGAAVDVGVVDGKGALVDMGSPFDHFGAASHTGGEAELIRRGVITRRQADNRAVLTRAMRAAGFTQHPKEWWHFQKYTRQELAQRYKRLDF